MQKKNIKLQELIKRTEISRTTLLGILKTEDLSFVSLGNLLKIALVLKCNVRDLYFEEFL